MISTPCQTPLWWSTCVQVGLPPATETCRATATTASSRDSLPQFEEGSEPRRGNQSWSTSSTCAGPTVDRWSSYTNFTFDFKGVIDYIFYSADFLTPLGLMGPVSMDWARECKVIGCPNPHFPSDHFPLLCQFELLPQH